MAQKVTVAREDDLDGGPAVETLRFGLEGAEFEIDLNGANAQAFRAQMLPFVERARKATRGLARQSARTASSRQRSRDIRAWARENNIAIRDRGRIPASVTEQYRDGASGR